MSMYHFKKAEQLKVKINGTCSHTGKQGVIIAADISTGKVSRDTLTKVKIRGIDTPASLRVLCFEDHHSVIEKLKSY